MPRLRILRRVSTPTRYSQRDVLRYATAVQRRQLLELAETLHGQRILHVNATAIGGGVAEILQSFVPYLRALGVSCEWYVINPKRVPPNFFVVTKQIHNALQGSAVKLSAAEWKLYRRVNALIAADIRTIRHDLLVINDPQPLGSLPELSDRPSVYISHIDTSAAAGATWKKFFSLAQASQAIIFSNRKFIHHDLQRQRVHIIPPAIDPLAIKQRLVSTIKARRYLTRYGVPKRGPLIAQISRFDVWKNPLGVVTAHHLVHQAHPTVQTILVGLKQAKDDPEADRIYRDVVRTAEEHKAIHVFFRPWGIKNIPEFTMMAQNAADIIIQNSIKEGFGLTLTEAMWKGKPVVGGPADGLRLQIAPGKNGLIARNSTELALAVNRLLTQPKLRRRLGRAAHASVQRRYLLHRFVLDHLRVYARVLSVHRT